VVELGSASRAGDDTSSVTLEGNLIGLNGNRDWSLVESGLELSRAHRLDILESSNFTNTLRGIVFADSISGSVRIVSLELKRSSLNVLESVVHETTIASVVLLGAVNELLLGVGLEGSSGNILSTFNGTGGGESPA